MSIIKVQINHTSNLSKEYLASHLYDEIGEEYNISEYEVENYFNIEYVLKLPNLSFITVFSLDFPLLALRDQEPKDVVKSYLDTLNSLDSVSNVVKMQDDILQVIALQYYNKLFELEMELRNVVTYILTFDEKQINNDVFKDFGIRIAESYNENSAFKEYENGLYYILFNYYASFSDPLKLKVEKVSELLQSNHIRTFEDFNNEIEKRYIKEQRHIDFLFSIKLKLEPLEKMRNAVMHTRNLSNTLIANFEKSAYDNGTEKGVETLIKEFWKVENDILKEQTWVRLAEIELDRYIIKNSGEHWQIDIKISDEVTLSDDEEIYESNDDIKTYIIDDLNTKINVPDFEPNDESIALIMHLIDAKLQFE